MDYHETLSKIKQTGSLRDYQKEFEYLSTRVHGWSEKALIGTFMGGLKSESVAEVKLKKPKTLMQALGVARIKEDQLQDLTKNSCLDVRKPPLMVSKFDANKTFSKDFAPGGPSGGAAGVKRISWEEMQR